MKRLAVIESGNGIGGAEVNLFRLAPLVTAAGWETIVLVPKEGPLTKELSRRGIQWRCFRSRSFKSTSTYFHRFKAPNPAAILYDCFAVLQQAKVIAQVLKEEKATLVHTNSMLSHFTGALAARRLGIPCLWHLQDIVHPWSGFGLFHPFLNLAGRALASSIVCISQSVANQLRWLKSSTIRLVYNGVDETVFSAEGHQPYRNMWLGNQYEMIVGHVGRLTPWKGQDLVIELAKRARKEQLPIRFVIIGDETLGVRGYGDQLSRLAKRNGVEDQVLFMQWLDDMPGAYRSMDLLIHPVREPEPFGLVVAEAMSCGKPVVAFNYGGAGEVIGSSEYGILVKPGSVDDLWKAIKWAYENPAAATAIGARARSRISANFSLRRFSAQMLKVYESLSWQAS